MQQLVTKRRLLYALVPLAVIAVAAFAILELGFQTEGDGQPDAWPSLIMTYDETESHIIGDNTPVATTKTYRFTFTSNDSWIEEVIAAPSVQTSAGTFSDVGSYQKVENGQHITYDATSGSTRTTALEEGTIQIPRSRLHQVSLDSLKEHVDSSPTKVATISRVCFNEDCADSAQGWRFMDGSVESIYADDARGMPLKLGDFVITDLQVQSAKQPVEDIGK